MIFNEIFVMTEVLFQVFFFFFNDLFQVELLVSVNTRLYE